MDLTCRFVCITGTGFEGQDVTVHSVYAAFLKSIKALLQEGTGLGVRVKLDESNPVDDRVQNYAVILYAKHLSVETHRVVLHEVVS